MDKYKASYKGYNAATSTWEVGVVPEFEADSFQSAREYIWKNYSAGYTSFDIRNLEMVKVKVVEETGEVQETVTADPDPVTTTEAAEQKEATLDSLN